MQEPLAEGVDRLYLSPPGVSTVRANSRRAKASFCWSTPSSPMFSTAARSSASPIVAHSASMPKTPAAMFAAAALV